MSDESTIFTPLEVRAGVQHWKKQKEPTEFGNGKSGSLNGYLTKATVKLEPEGPVKSDYDRKLVVAWLVTPDDEPLPNIDEFSTNDLTPQEWNGIWRWISPSYTDWDNKFLPRSKYEVEARWILNCALFDKSRVKPDGEPFLMKELVAFWKDHLASGPEHEEYLAQEAIEISGIPTFDLDSDPEDPDVINAPEEYVEELEYADQPGDEIGSRNSDEIGSRNSDGINPADILPI